MPCFDCFYWTKPQPYEPRSKRADGFCQHDKRASHANYRCGVWRQKDVTHTEVGLTPVEVAWARRNPGNLHVRALSALFRQIEGRPNDDALRQVFAERLEEWRANRANSGEALLSATAE